MDLIRNPKPYIFDEFFAFGQEESVSPFLKKGSRKWAYHLPLKNSLFSLFLLLFSFGIFYVNKPAGYFFLSFVYFLMGLPSLIHAVEDLRKLEINLDLLMTLSAFLALGIGSPFEGALLLVLFALAGALENAVSYKTRGSIHALKATIPSSANLLQEDGTVVEKSIQDIEVGMKLFVQSGEMVPVDGKVCDGASSISIAHLTGESQPIAVHVGDEIPGGSLNIEGSLTISATKEGTGSAIIQIIKLIASAEEKKPKMERFFFRFGKSYSLFVIFATLAFALFAPFFFSFSFFGIEGSIYRALTFMIAASPCALIIAIPSAYLSAISSSAKKGIIIKGGAILDALCTCKKIAFDKTGTLTEGKLSFTSIEPVEKSILLPDNALQLGASVEKASTHPVALSLCNAAKEKKLPLLPSQDFVTFPGDGVEGKIAIKDHLFHVRLGKKSFIEEFLSGPQKEALHKALEKAATSGDILSLLLIDSSLFLLHFQDALRKETKKLIDEIKEHHHLEPMILTGDIEENALKIGACLQIKKIFALLRPEDKLKKISKFSQKEGLIMVGDGINDAPALARATVGISMGKIASATALNASDVVLLSDRLLPISWLLEKAKSTKRIVFENLFLAITVIALASIPSLIGALPLWLAVILHEGGTLLVGLNSLRLLKQ